MSFVDQLKKNIARPAFVAWTGVLLAACSGGGGSTSTPATQTDTTAPTANVDRADAVLSKNSPVVIHFSETMSTASLHLAGVLAADSDGGVWSTSTNANDTLTISPQNGSWKSGANLDLTVNATDLAGNALPTLTKSYLVKLVFDNFQAADVVIGQADFGGKSPNQGSLANANTLDYPNGAYFADDGKLFISDNANNRVLAFNALPTMNNASADFVLGQPNFTTTTSNGTNRTSYWLPLHAIPANGKLIVVDWLNSRVLVYNSIPTSGAAIPDVVVGQPDFTSNNQSCSASVLNQPRAAAVTPDGKLIVSDGGNRVLIWNSIPTTNGKAADMVLGQSNFTHCVANDDNQDYASDAAPSARTLNSNWGIWTDGKKLAVSDNNNFRLLIWSSFPTSSFQPADIVIGQSDFAHHGFNDDNQDGSRDAAPSARTVGGGVGIGSNGVQLAVTDGLNNRTMIWNSFPTSSFQPADVVLGQSDFAHGRSNDDNQDGVDDGVASARVLNVPDELIFYQDKLVVTDTQNHRVLVFKSR